MRIQWGQIPRVFPSGTTTSGSPLEDDKIMQPGLLEGMGEGEACRASPNDHDTHADRLGREVLNCPFTLLDNRDA